jgi:ABC-type multidrug transport system permease subunit
LTRIAAIVTFVIILILLYGMMRDVVWTFVERWREERSWGWRLCAIALTLGFIGLVIGSLYLLLTSHR